MACYKFLCVVGLALISSFCRYVCDELCMCKIALWLGYELGSCDVSGALSVHFVKMLWMFYLFNLWD